MFLCRQDWFYKGMTGITRASKESMFSELNDPNVVTTTSEEYSTSFGFTEDELYVFSAYSIPAIQELYFHYIVITQQYTLVWYTLPAYQLSC